MQQPAYSRPNIAGVSFDLTDYGRVVEAISCWRRNGERRMVAITNPHSILMCRRDPEMGRATAAAGLTLPDGVGVILAARVLGLRHCGRISGPMLVLKLCDWGRARGFRHFFYGGREGVADTMAARLCLRYPGLEVAGSYCPPFRELSEEEDAKAVRAINRSRPDIVWVGLGAPKQEKWMAAHLGRVEAAAMIGVGAAFDFHSGAVPWAPDWVRRCGLEWAYRLALEPRRMWRRNLDSPVFLLIVLRQRLGLALGWTGAGTSARPAGCDASR